MSEPSLSQIRDAMPFATLIGVELLDACPEMVRGRLDFSPRRCTTGGVIHGGRARLPITPRPACEAPVSWLPSNVWRGPCASWA
jgi:hypothetical protein